MFIFPLVKITRDSQGNTQIYILYTSVDRAWQYLMRDGYIQYLTVTSKEAELPDAVTREVSMRNIIEEERNGASGRKRKYTHLTLETKAKTPSMYAAQCGNTAAVKHFANNFPH